MTLVLKSIHASFSMITYIMILTLVDFKEVNWYNSHIFVSCRGSRDLGMIIYIYIYIYKCLVLLFLPIDIYKGSIVNIYHRFQNRCIIRALRFS